MSRLSDVIHTVKSHTIYGELVWATPPRGMDVGNVSLFDPVCISVADLKFRPESRDCGHFSQVD